MVDHNGFYEKLRNKGNPRFSDITSTPGSSNPGRLKDYAAIRYSWQKAVCIFSSRTLID
jgi:hypothetical protein